MLGIEPLLQGLDASVRDAIRFFWSKREAQIRKQVQAGRHDAGARGAVTGGAQMDGFIQLVTALLTSVGVHQQHIFYKRSVELPGYYRPTKEWDLLVVVDGQLLLVVEAKSQVGPSFGNNFNNRAEEAVGSAVDLWTAYREGAFDRSVKPWLGYLFVLEECARSTCAVKVNQPHFTVFPEFVDASYAKRYEIFCRKLVRERNYDAAAFLLSEKLPMAYSEPAEDLTFELFARSMLGHVTAFRGAK